MIKELPERLRKQAEVIEADGHLTAARLMCEAAFELEHMREDCAMIAAMYKSQPMDKLKYGSSAGTEIANAIRNRATVRNT